MGYIIPGPYPKFETAFETFEKQITELLTTQQQELLAAMGKNPQAPAPAPLDLAAFRTTIQQAIKDEVVAQSKTFIQQPQEKPNPLAFYETILKVRSTPNPSQNLLLPMTIPRPYFADVFNDVVSYFGGPNTTDPIGRRFLEEAGKRFAYLRAEVWGQTDVPLFQQGGMIMFNGFTTMPGGWQQGIPFGYGWREFAILRQLLEDIYSEEEEATTLGDLARIAIPSPKKVISSDLADILRK